MIDTMDSVFDETQDKERIDFGMVRGDYFLNLEIPEQEEILSPFLKVGSIVWISSNPSSLKTYFTLGLCSSIVKGERFGRWDVKREGVKVLYIDGELPEKMFQERVKQMNLDRKENFYVLSKSMCPDVLRNQFYLINDRFREYVLDMCKRERIDLVVFDNISSLTMGIDENSKKDFDLISHYFMELRHNDISVIVIEHNNKKGVMRGSSSKLDTPDVSIRIERNDMDKDEITISFVKYRYKLDDRIKGKIRFVMMCDENNHISWKEVEGNTLDRDKQILMMICEGKTQKEIGDRFCIDRSSVSHIKKLYEDRKLYLDKSFTQEGMEYFGLTPLGN